MVPLEEVRFIPNGLGGGREEGLGGMKLDFGFDEVVWVLGLDFAVDTGAGDADATEGVGEPNIEAS